MFNRMGVFLQKLYKIIQNSLQTVFKLAAFHAESKSLKLGGWQKQIQRNQALHFKFKLHSSNLDKL